MSRILVLGRAELPILVRDKLVPLGLYVVVGKELSTVLLRELSKNHAKVLQLLLKKTVDAPVNDLLLVV